MRMIMIFLKTPEKCFIMHQGILNYLRCVVALSLNLGVTWK